MRLEDLSDSTFLGREFRTLVCKCKRWFSNEREYNFGLVAFVDVLENLLSMADLRRGKRVHFKSKIGHSSLAHFLLMGDASNCE